MPEDASLDAFAASDDEGGESATDADRAPDADPAVSTFEWSPDGGECAACGASVERRWRDDGKLVCTDCKEW